MMDAVHALITALAADWKGLGTAGLTFWQRDIARLAGVGFVAFVALLVVLRASLPRRRTSTNILLAAVLPTVAPPRALWLRHVPALLFAAGLPFALLALADPRASLVAAETSYPGRRIALMIDGSDSMRSDFTAPDLNAGTQQAFFTTIAAAKKFVDLRREGRYKDLISLIEFGNRAYVITPFTNDYDNLLLSLSLIGDPEEFRTFPDPGTIIGSAVEQSVSIFKAFDFLEAAGNVMVMFTDGEDTNAFVNGRPLEDIFKVATENKIPVYFVRLSYNKDYEGTADALWKEVVEGAGGKFFVARDESTLLEAIAEIDRESAGEIQYRQYTAQEPRFVSFALIALALWSSAAGLRFLVPVCSALP